LKILSDSGRGGRNIKPRWGGGMERREAQKRGRKALEKLILSIHSQVDTFFLLKPPFQS